MTKGIIFYTDNEVSPKIEWEVEFRLKTITKEVPGWGKVSDIIQQLT